MKQVMVIELACMQYAGQKESQYKSCHSFIAPIMYSLCVCCWDGVLHLLQPLGTSTTVMMRDVCWIGQTYPYQVELDSIGIHLERERV